MHLMYNKHNKYLQHFLDTHVSNSYMQEKGTIHYK